MKVLVTGGSGFIGTNLVEYMSGLDADVVNYDISPPRNPAHMDIWIRGDILDKELLNKVVTEYQPEYFIHLAARTDLDGQTISDYEENTTGVENVIYSLQGISSLKRVLFASSRLVCKIGYAPRSDHDYCPSTAYGESKVEGEKIVRAQAKDLSCCWGIFRPTSIWGPWFDTPYKEFFMSVLKSHYVHPKGKVIRKSFGYVGNSVYMINQFIRCESSLIDRKTIYLTDYPAIEVKSWADHICIAAGVRKPIEVPLFVLRFMAFCGDLLKVGGYKNPPLTKFRLDNLLTDMLYETNNLEEICGELPYDLVSGVNETLTWIEHEG